MVNKQRISIFLFSIILSLTYFIDLASSVIRCLEMETPMSPPPCWALNSSITCNWCARECLPVDPMRQPYEYCRNGETCCQHECGTYCLKRHQVMIPPPVKACVDPVPRVACPPLEHTPLCPHCEDLCLKDMDCDPVGGGGRICCPTRCGKRCHETLIF